MINDSTGESKELMQASSSEKSSIELSYEKQNEDVIRSFDENINYLKQMNENSEEEQANLKKVQAIFKKLNNDSKKLAARIHAQNQKSSTVMQGLHRVSHERGIMGKGRATLSLVGLVADKAPFVGKLKQYVTKEVLGDLHLHNEFEKQYTLANGIKEQLETLLYGEKSELIEARESLIKQISSDQERLLELKGLSEEKISLVDKTENEAGLLKVGLVEKYNLKYNKILLDKLDIEDFKVYQNISELDNNVFIWTREVGNYKKEMKDLAHSIMDSRTNLKTYLLMYSQAEEQYAKMENVLEQSETSVQTRAAVSQLESCLSNACEVYRNLSANYQELQVKDSQTIKEMAKNSESLIPDRLSSPSSMIAVNENLRDATISQIEHDPYGVVGKLESAMGEDNLYLGDNEAHKQLPQG
jgi:hypothetical protein